MIPDPKSKPMLRDHSTEKTQGTEWKPNQYHVNQFKTRNNYIKIYINTHIYIYIYIYIYTQNNM